jgi:hypothetical protein
VPVGEVRLSDRRPQLLNSQVENHGLARESPPTQNQLASYSEASDSGRTRGLDDSELHILEIPDDRLPDLSPAETAETEDDPHPTWSFRSAWLKLALSALGVVCLLIWLVAPRSARPQTPGQGRKLGVCADCSGISLTMAVSHPVTITSFFCSVSRTTLGTPKP